MAVIRLWASLFGLNSPRHRIQSLARSRQTLWQSQLWHSTNAAMNLDHRAIERSDVSPILLRDLCTCIRCVDPSTRQKLFSTTDIPHNIQVNAQTQKPNAIEITWKNDIPSYNDDHISTIPREIIQRILATRATTPKIKYPKKIIWDDKEFRRRNSADIPYEDYMSDDRTLYKVVRQLHQYGLVFIQGVPESEESVSRIAERIGPLKTTFYGRTWDVRSVPKAINVAYTSQNLGFHMDLLYMQQPPHIQLLHCIRSSAAGGASLFTDSFKSAVDLSEIDMNAFKGLVNARVDFHYDHPGSQYYHQARRVIETKKLPVAGEPAHIRHISKDGASEERFGSPPSIRDFRLEDHIDDISWSPPFQAPFSADLENVDGSNHEPNEDNLKDLGASTQEWHSHASKFDELIHRPEVIHERMMKPGECVLFDNRRVLHARRAFEVGDQGKERWLRGAYIDKDPFMSQLKILLDKYHSTDPDED